MLHPGFEPGLPVPQTGVLTTRLIELYMEIPGFDPGASRLQSARSSNWAIPPEQVMCKMNVGAKWESNPRPLAPKARIMPLDHWPTEWYDIMMYELRESNSWPLAC